MTQIVSFSELSSLPLELNQLAETSKDVKFDNIVKHNQFTFDTIARKTEILGKLNFNIRTDTETLDLGVEDASVRTRLEASVKDCSVMKQQVFDATIPRTVCVTLNHKLFSLSNSNVQFRFDNNIPYENNHVWLTISPETFDFFSEFAERVNRTIGSNVYFANCLRNTGPRQMISCQYTPCTFNSNVLKPICTPSDTNTMEHHMAIRSNHKGRGRCIVAPELKLIDSYNIVKKCHESRYVLVFRIVRLQFTQ
jgi:hypothetical protein